MSTRGQRLNRVLELIREMIEEGDFNSLRPIDWDITESCKKLVKGVNDVLDEEFEAGHDYCADPTAPLLPKLREQRAVLLLRGHSDGVAGEFRY